MTRSHLVRKFLIKTSFFFKQKKFKKLVFLRKTLFLLFFMTYRFFSYFSLKLYMLFYFYKNNYLKRVYFSKLLSMNVIYSTLFSNIVLSFQFDLFYLFKLSLNHSVCWLIKKVNYYLLNRAQIWGWFFFFNLRHYRAFHREFDSWLYEKQIKYIQTTSLNQSFLWKIRKFFGPFNPYSLDSWIFGDRNISLYLLKSFWIL